MQNIIGDVYYVDGFINGKIIFGILMIPHASREEYRTLHAFDILWNCVILDYVIWWLCALVKLGELCEMWLVNYTNFVIYVISKYCELCRNVHMIMFVILGDAYTLVNLFGDNYVGNSNDVRSIYIWLGDSFDNDDFFAYTLKWWIVFVELIRQKLMWFIWLMWIR